jgi:hypothetical protein
VGRRESGVRVPTAEESAGPDRGKGAMSMAAEGGGGEGGGHCGHGRVSLELRGRSSGETPPRYDVRKNKTMKKKSRVFQYSSAA